MLVPGQVEDDASIRWGAPGVKTNLELLRAARAAEPDAWIVYKPHPDTEAGTRAGRLDDAEALRHAAPDFGLWWHPLAMVVFTAVFSAGVLFPARGRQVAAGGLANAGAQPSPTI